MCRRYSGAKSLTAARKVTPSSRSMARHQTRCAAFRGGAMSMFSTSSPREANRSTRFVPMKPEPPVTRTRILRVLVTGGSGFIGTNLVERFASRGDDVLNIDIAPPRNAAHRVWWRAIDLLDGVTFRAAVKDFAPEYLLHMAARTDLNGRSVDDYDVNTVGVGNVIAAVEGAASLQSLIFASSRLVCRIG